MLCADHGVPRSRPDRAKCIADYTAVCLLALFVLLSILLFFFYFFFSSRRRHTRFDCDWSSDVCSSDLLRDRLPEVMHHAERGVAVLRLRHDHAQRAHVVELGEVELLRAHLVPDGIDMLRPPADLCVDIHRPQLSAQCFHTLGDVLLALQALLVEHARDALIELGLEIAERQVLELPLELPDAQAVRERRVDIERFPGVRTALFVRVFRKPSERLGPAGEPDQHHAHVLGHAEHHLAQHLVLFARRATRGDAKLVELLDAAGERGDLFAERLLQLLRPFQVLGRREEDARRPPRRVEPDRGQARREAEGVRPCRFPGREHLPGIERLGKLERPPEHRALGPGKPGAERVQRRAGRQRMQLDDTQLGPRLHAGILRAMGWLTNWRRRRVLEKHRIDDALWQRATGGLAFVPKSEKLKELALLFLAEKQFAGAHGLEVSDEMRVSIAAQACVPILELGLDWYSGFTGIVVYPGDFRVQREQVDEHGVVHEWDDELAGEAMPGGPVVLSWDATANDPYINVVVHEFAHKLDMLNGPADGLPPLHAGMDRAAWATAFEEAYEGFCDAVERGKETWLDPYAAEDPSEFFAVISESFFEQPAETKRRYPDVYEQLRLFYKQDPL